MKLILNIVLSLWAMASFVHADDVEESDVGKRLQASADVLNQIMSAPDMNIPAQVLAEAKCIVEVPSLVKIALGIGGRQVLGVATCRTARGRGAHSGTS